MGLMCWSLLQRGHRYHPGRAQTGRPLLCGHRYGRRYYIWTGVMWRYYCALLGHGSTDLGLLEGCVAAILLVTQLFQAQIELTYVFLYAGSRTSPTPPPAPFPFMDRKRKLICDPFKVKKPREENLQSGVNVYPSPYPGNNAAPSSSGAQNASEAHTKCV